MTQQIKILPPDQADATAYMRTLFLRTEQEIINVIKRKRKAGYVDYAEVAALERVQKILQSMIDQSWAYRKDILSFRQSFSWILQCPEGD